MVKENKLVEIGRVCFINYGEDAGKACTIVDVVDQSRALVDGPHSQTGVKRQTIPFSRLSLTAIAIKIPRAIGSTALASAWTKQNVSDAVKKTSWAKKLARQTVRRSLNDFQRFQLMVIKKKKQAIINTEVRKLKKAGGVKPSKKKKVAPKKKVEAKPAAKKAAPQKQQEEKGKGKEAPKEAAKAEGGKKKGK